MLGVFVLRVRLLFLLVATGGTAAAAATAGLAASGLDAFVGVIRLTSSTGDAPGLTATLTSVGGVISLLLSWLPSAGVDAAFFFWLPFRGRQSDFERGILTS